MISVLLLVAAGTITVAIAQPGPYALWSAPTNVRMSGPVAGGTGAVYAMPFLYSEEGELPFELGAWSNATGQMLFNVSFSGYDQNRTGDWKGMTPAVTMANLAPKGSSAPDMRPVVLYGFHNDLFVKAVDGITGRHLWTVVVIPSQCGILYCQITGISSPVAGSFIVEQASFLLRLDAATGHVVWNTSVSGNDGNPGSWRSHVAADTDSNFIYTTRDYVHSVDFYTGGFLYSAQVSVPHCTALACVLTDYTPPVVSGDFVYVGGNGIVLFGNQAAIVCLWKRTGSVKWFRNLTSFVWSVAADGAVAVANPGTLDISAGATFAGFSATTGDVLWNHTNTTWTYYTDVAIDPATHNVVIAATTSYTQTLLVINGQSGAIVGSMGSSISGQRPFFAVGSTVYVSLSSSDGGSDGINSIYFGN